MTCGYIYKIEFPNGKHYIGSLTPCKRANTELRGVQIILKKMMFEIARG